MEITVNGEKQHHRDPLTVGGLLQSLGIDRRSVVVERNLQIVARTEMENEPVVAGDAIEIIRFVGGG
ncbi:MAG: sulfur carrier protein ThiS [Deltaproteobacteria bacterium]|nr:sulfur carrier protein ThiS [Deltaproteobacteria bacterium]